MATFSFAPGEPYGFEDLHLTISRAGATLVDSAPAVRNCDMPYCSPGGGDQNPSVRVRDLDGDGQPEVLLDLLTGGAHCCLTLSLYRFNGGGYSSVEHNFADVGYRLQDLNADGRMEFMSADTRFAYRFDRLPTAAFRFGCSDAQAAPSKM